MIFILVLNTSTTFMQITLLPQNGLFTAARQALANGIFPEGKEQRDTLTRDANTDALTGLANRRAFDRARSTAEADSGTAFIIFDVNNFKKVNDQLDHLTGDKVLQNIAQVITLVASRYRLGNRVFRIGGDEFAIICPAHAARLIRDKVEQMYEPFVISPGVMVSISGTTGSTYLEADAKLQARKQEHKNAR